MKNTEVEDKTKAAAEKILIPRKREKMDIQTKLSGGIKTTFISPQNNYENEKIEEIGDLDELLTAKLRKASGYKFLHIEIYKSILGNDPNVD